MAICHIENGVSNNSGIIGSLQPFSVWRSTIIRLLYPYCHCNNWYHPRIILLWYLIKIRCHWWTVPNFELSINFKLWAHTQNRNALVLTYSPRLRLFLKNSHLPKYKVWRHDIIFTRFIIECLSHNVISEKRYTIPNLRDQWLCISQAVFARLVQSYLHFKSLYTNDTVRLISHLM